MTLRQAQGEDWLEVLRAECAATNQARVARRNGYTPGVVSGVLKRTYKGDLKAIEQAVRGALMSATVNCPVLGDLPADRCLKIQKQPLAATTPQRVALWKACRGGCPHSRLPSTSSGIGG